MHLRPGGQLMSNWWLEARPCPLLSLSSMAKEHIVCSWVMTRSMPIVASFQQCTNALSNGRETTSKWFWLTRPWVWWQLIQPIRSLKIVNASLEESGKEASSRSTMNVNSWSKQSALRVYFSDSFCWLLRIGWTLLFWVHQNMDVLFQGVEFGFNCIILWRSLTDDDFWSS